MHENKLHHAPCESFSSATDQYGDGADRSAAETAGTEISEELPLGVVTGAAAAAVAGV